MTRRRGMSFSFIVHAFDGKYDKDALAQAVKKDKYAREALHLAELEMLEKDGGELIDIPSPDVDALYIIVKRFVTEYWRGDVKDRGPKKAIFTIFGMRLARDLLGLDYPPELEAAVMNYIRISASEVLIEKVSQIWTILATYARNYEELVKTEKFIRKLELKLHHGEFDEWDTPDKLETQKMQAERYSKQLQNSPFVRVTRRKDKREWFAITTDALKAAKGGDSGEFPDRIRTTV